MNERLYCDCCGKQVMAIKRGDRVIIKAVHHGQEHVLVVLLHPVPLTQPV